MKRHLLLITLFLFIVVGATFAQQPNEGWVRIGISYTGDITALAVSPNYDIDQTLFIGVRGQGLLYSNNRGKNWSYCLAIPCDATVTGIALPGNYQYNSETPCFAVTEEGDFYRSDDDFQTITFSYQFYNPLKGIVYPATSIVILGVGGFEGQIYVGTYGDGVYFNSNDGDPANWYNISLEIRELDYCNSLSITSQTPHQIIWASSNPSTAQGKGVYFSSGGYSWTGVGATPMFGEDTPCVFASWKDARYVWAGTKSKGMWLSTNSGASWSKGCDGSDGGGLPFSVDVIRECPQIASDHEIWEGTSETLNMSNDMGNNCTPGFPASDINVIGFSPSYHSSTGYCDAFVGTKSALFRISCQYPTSAVSPPLVDGKCVAIAKNGKSAFMGSTNRGLFKCVNLGSSGRKMVEYNNFPNDKIPEIVSICLHPDYYEGSSACGDEKTLFVAANFYERNDTGIHQPTLDSGIYKSIDGGNSWIKMVGGEWPSLPVEVRDLAISPNYATDGTLFAVTKNQVFRWDGGTVCWKRVATENTGFADIRFISLPPQYDKNSTCSFGGVGDIPCHLVFIGVKRDTDADHYLAVSYDNGGYFGIKSSLINPTGITFPSNYCTGSNPATLAIASSSTLGVQATESVTFDSWSPKNLGLPSQSGTGYINVADISADPLWIHSGTPTRPYINIALPYWDSLNASTSGGWYYSNNTASSWTRVRPGSAISVAFEPPGAADNVIAGFKRTSSTSTYGSYFSSSPGSSTVPLTGYWSLPADVNSSVAHERDPNIVFASSPSMGVFVSTDKGESFHPYNVGKGGSTGPCYLTNGYGITMLSNRRGSDLDVVYVGTTDGIKSRYIYTDSSGCVNLDYEDSSHSTTSAWRHSTLSGGGNTTGYWERFEVVPNSSQNYPVWAISAEKTGYTAQGYASLLPGTYEGWVFQNTGLPSSPNTKGVRIGFSSGNGVQPIISGSPIKETVKQGEWDYYSINVSNATTDLKVFLDDPDDYGSQDADLYVKYGATPTTTSYDYRPYINGDETVCIKAILMENFNESWGPYGNTPPPGWTIADFGDESPKVWNNNDWHRYANGSYGYSARVYYSPVENSLEDLKAPLFNIPTGLTSCTLDFDHYFRNYNPSGEYGRVWFMSDQTSWVKLAEYTTNTGGMVHSNIYLTPYIGHTNCQLAFQYEGNSGWYWIVDNVRVTGASPQKLKTGTWYIGVRGYALGDNGYTLTATLDSGCTGSYADLPPGTGKDPKYANYIPPDPKAPISGTAWGTVTATGVVRGTGTSTVTWSTTSAQPSNLNTKTIIQLPDTTLVVGCDASSTSDKGIFYSPAGDEGNTQWYEASSLAGSSSKNYVDIIQSSNGDLLIAGNGSGSTPGGVWLSGDKGKNWMNISTGFDSSSQALEDIVADSGTPVSYYSSTNATGLWTRTITANPYPTITGITPNNGSDQGGTSVTITGTNFSNSCPTGLSENCPSTTPIVIFGDNNGTTAYEVPGTYSSSTQITAITPAHQSGTVSVKVRNPDTRETSSGVNYTFNFTCLSPSGMANNTASDLDPCADTGVQINWTDPSDWGDQGSGTRSYDVLRDGTAIATGLSSATHTYTDNSGVNGTTYTYSVRANNGCGQSYTTSGVTAVDNPSSITLTASDYDSSCGIEISFSGGSGAKQFDLWVDGVQKATSILTGYIYTPIDSTSHNYIVRGIIGGGCYVDSNTSSASDPNCGSVPPEVATGTNFTWTADQGSQTMNWVSEPTATGYRVYRGTTSLLPNLCNTDQDFCNKYGGTNNYLSITSDNPSTVEGRCLFYLITGYNGAGEGTAGEATCGPRQINISGGC